MPPEIQLDLLGLFTPAPAVHKSPPPHESGGTGIPPVCLKNLPDTADKTPVSPAPHRPENRAAQSARLVFVRSPRARHYRLTLKHDGTAVVTIPARGSEREARRFADEHTGWLARARARQEKRPRAANTWAIGTQIPWRGEMTTIRVAPASTPERPAVTLDTGTIRVASLTADLRPTLESHFLRIAKIELPARTWELAAETRVPVTQVTVRNQRTRWGSCTAAGVISLNWRLVQAPLFVRDYIICHELMHLREMNHSPRFWARVAEICPYWQDAERWIKQNGSLLGL